MPTLVAQMTITDQGLDFIGSFEGFRADLYNDPAGHATIGYGHLVHLGPINGSEPAEFKRPLSQQQALDLLRSDAANFVEAVRNAVTVPLTQAQFDALVSFTFNVGAGNLRDSTLLSKLNAGDYAAARAEFAKWNKAGGQVMAGLVRRRAAESAMFGGNMLVSLGALRRGSRDPDVMTFQMALRRKGFAHLNPSGATGFYGDQTCAMCSAAHAANGLTVPDPTVPDGRLIARLGLEAR